MPYPPIRPFPSFRPPALVGLVAGGVLALATAGCYQHIPLEGPPPVGMQVEITLHDEAREGLSDRGVTIMRFANTSVDGIDGLVLAATDDSLTVRVASTRVNAFADGLLYQQVSLAYSDLAHIQQRKHNVAGTLAVVSAFGGLGLFVANRIARTSSDDAAR